jgi:hypothetical protein
MRFMEIAREFGGFEGSIGWGKCFRNWIANRIVLSRIAWSILESSSKKNFSDAHPGIGPLKMEQWKDRLGIFASVACAVHCAATPVLLATLPALTFTEWMASPLFHQVIAVGCCALVASAIWPAFMKFRDYRILSLSSAGLGMILMAAFVLPDECCKQALPGQDVAVAGFSGAKLISAKRTPEVASCCSNESADTKACDGHACQDACKETEVASNDHAGHNHAGHDHAAHDHAGHDHAAHDHAAHDHAGHDHASHENASVVSSLAGIQPWMTPIGGLLLIAAHGLNLRRRLQREVACCDAGDCQNVG